MTAHLTINLEHDKKYTHNETPAQICINFNSYWQHTEVIIQLFPVNGI